MHISIDAAVARLLERKNALESKIHGKRASERSRRYASLVELPQVEAALIRLRSGDYGECLDCSEPIEVDRLNAIPEAPTCKKCGKNNEPKKGAAHERFG